jgi:uncharacterized protein YndB with AHSA1/START domain
MATGNTMANEEQALVLTRVFDAPRELVFKAWTDPQRVARWWGPTGLPTQSASWTRGPGASSAFT